VLNLHLVLRQALGQAVRWELLAANPAAGAQPPRPRRAAPLVADPALLERLLAATAGSLYELPCALAVATGMRRGELLALRWSDLSPERRQARVVRSLHRPRRGWCSRNRRAGARATPSSCPASSIAISTRSGGARRSGAWSPQAAGGSWGL